MKIFLALLLTTSVALADDVILDDQHVTVPGDYATPWAIDGDLTVGMDAASTSLTISSGASVTNHAAFIAYDPGSAATVTVTGAGSSWATTGDLNFGYSGDATLDIEAGGSVSATGSVIFNNGPNTINIGAYDLAHATGGGTLHATELSANSSGAVLNFNQNDTVTFDTAIVSGAASVVLRGNGTTIFTAANNATTLAHQGITIFDGSTSTTGHNYLAVGVDSGDNADLRILGASQVTNFQSNIGDGLGSTGYVTVTGTGTLWTLGGELHVGEYGNGTLSIEEGGAVDTSGGSTYIGRYGPGASGMVSVGSDTVWTAGFIGIAAEGTGQLVVFQGGTVNSTSVSLASFTGSDATLTVTGPGAKWTNTSDVTLGDFGHATLNVWGGGSATITGSLTSSLTNSEIDVSGVDADSHTSSSLSGITVLDIGSNYAGLGQMTVEAGGSVTDETGRIGRSYTAGSEGFVTVTGAGSTWANTTSLTVGNAGKGTLEIKAGGSVTGLDGAIGNSTGSSTAKVLVTGAGSNWTATGNISVGDGGQNTGSSLHVEAGGTVADAIGRIAMGNGANAAAVITGTGSKWTSSDSLEIGGDFSTATLDIEDGGAASAQTIRIGAGFAATATVTVTGAGSSLAATDGSHPMDLIVGDGDYSTGILNVEHGATASGMLHVGNQAASEGTVTVTGIGSKLESDAVVGSSGKGTIDLLGGATWTGGATLGKEAGSEGTVTVSGAGSSWSTLGTIAVGREGKGTLNVTEGGHVSANGMNIGSGEGSLNVSGTGSSVQSYVQATGSTITLSAGGTLDGGANLTLNASTLNIGSPDLSHPTTAGTANVGTIQFIDAALNFNQTDDITISAELTSLAFGYGRLVQQGSGTTTLTGLNLLADSTTVIHGTLSFGARQSLADGGPQFLTPDKLVVGFGATAAFHVGGPQGFTAEDLDALKSLGTVTTGFRYGATLGIDTSDVTGGVPVGGAFTYASDIANPNGGSNLLRLAKLGLGTLTLTGDNSYTGGTTIFDGTLVAGSNTALGTGDVVIKGGTLQLQGGVTLANTITLAGGSLATQLAGGTDLATLSSFEGNVAGGIVATTASLLGGTTSGTANLQTGFAATSPASNDNVRLSDIFTLSGVPVVDADTGETDWFVLQLQIPNVTLDSFLGWYNPTSMKWVNAVDGNFGGVSAFAGNHAYLPGTDFHLGTWGIDTTNGTVWAVLNHNSDFAITSVPEPSTYGIVMAALLGGAILLRRRAKLAAGG